jgi:uncharacterized Ntn-hydrolase superfamily protein
MKSYLLFCLVFVSSVLSGQHTFSIVAIDTLSGEIGAAGATCLTSADCGGCGGAIIINEIIPGVGAVNAQATVCLPNVNAEYVANELSSGSNAEEALAAVLSNDQCQFGNTADRQYGVVSFVDDQVQTASFTGESALSHAGHRTGDTYSIQGNILLGPEILDSMEARYLRATEAKLPIKDRLMEAMQGANVVGADSRCAPDGLSSKSAFLVTTFLTDDDTQVAIVEDTEPGVDPIDSLQTLVDDLSILVVNDVLDITDENQVTIMPNPSSDHVKIITKNQLNQYRLTSMDGTQVQSGELTTNTISVSTINNGIYLLSLFNDKEIVTKKLLIQRR